MKKRPIARCKICDTSIIAASEVQLSILMFSHILRKHFKVPKYEDLLTKLTELIKEDFEISWKNVGE